MLNFDISSLTKRSPLFLCCTVHSHPVRKIENYQKYLFENLSKAPKAFTSKAPKSFTSKSPAAPPAAAASAEEATPTTISHDLAMAEESDSEAEPDAASEADAGLIF